MKNSFPLHARAQVYFLSRLQTFDDCFHVDLCRVDLVQCDEQFSWSDGTHVALLVRYNETKRENRTDRRNPWRRCQIQMGATRHSISGLPFAFPAFTLRRRQLDVKRGNK